jgi:hypothetical protein
MHRRRAALLALLGEDLRWQCLRRSEGRPTHRDCWLVFPWVLNFFQRKLWPVPPRVLQAAAVATLPLPAAIVTLQQRSL